MIRWSKIVTFLALLHLVCGSEICSCSPLVYRWKIDFSLSCLPVGLNVGPNKGITNLDCDVVGDDASVTDLKPVVITSYQLSELDMNLQVFKSEAAQDLSLTSGDIVEFRSETAVNPAFYSGGFQAIFDAENELGQSIRFTWILVFSNICELEPFVPGQSIGWLSVGDDFDKASNRTCQKQSLAPSYSPTNISTRRPSAVPTTRPTYPSTPTPTRSPTASPTKTPHKSTVTTLRTSSPTLKATTILSASSTPSISLKPSVIGAPTISNVPSGPSDSNSGRTSIKSKKSKDRKSRKSRKRPKSYKAILIESYVPNARV